MKLFYKITSILLCITLALISFPTSVFATADNGDYKPVKQLNEEIVVGEPSDYSADLLNPESLKFKGKGEKTLKELKKIDISKIKFPKFISKDKALSRGHVNRLNEQENNLNTVIYQNRDGSKTAYIFTKPVKYIDEKGNVKDKDTTLSNIDHELYSYAMVNNSVKAFFPDKLLNGALIEYGKYYIKMTPVSEALQKSSVATSLAQASDNIILYQKVFGNNTDLRYTMLLSGIKEDIIINKYDGQTQFKFFVEADGLNARLNSNGYWQLFDNDRPIVTFEKIVIKDSNGKVIIGSMDIVCDDSENIIMTIEVPEKFLLDPSTEYPVYVDPTAYIWETSYNYDDEEERTSIIDVGLYASYDDYVMAEGSTILDLGEYDYDISKIIYKFPDFYDGDYGAYTWLNQYNIGSALLNIEFLSASSVTVNANPMTNTYSGATDPLQMHDPDLINSYSTVNGSSTYISSAGIKQIDITNIVKGWAKYNSGDTTESYCNPENGLLLSLEDEYDHATVASTEYSYSSNVYLELDYSYTGGEYYIYNSNEYKFLRNNTSNGLSLNSYSPANTQKWIFEYIGEDQFYIRSAYNPNYALYGSGSSVSLATLPTSPSNNYKWDINDGSGIGVIIKNCFSNYVLHVNGTSLNLIPQPASGTTAYNLCCWGYLKTSDYVRLTNISLSDNWIKTGTSKYLNINATPSNASWKGARFFTWTISDTSKINYTSSDGKFSGVSSGKVTLTLTNKLTGFSKSFTIACGNIREGQYMILNKGSGNYMDVEGPSKLSGAYIQQWEYHTGNQAKWNIMLMSNGDYVIQSVYSQKYLRVEDGSSSSGAAIIQFENCNWTSTRWKFEETSSGGYKIVPMLVSNFAIMVPSNSNDNGTNLVQNAYTNDTNYYDEWIFDNIGETPGINNGDVYTIKASHSSKAITAENGSTNNGTNISQYTLTPGYQWQRWKFLYLGNGEYKIQDMNSGKLLSISASSSSNRANAQLWYDDGTTGQIFKIKENTDGTYTFLSKCSYYIYALTVADGNMSDNANIYQYSNTGTSYQKFYLTKSNKAMIIVPGFGGSVLQMGSSYPFYNMFGDKDIFSQGRLNKITNVWDSIKDDISDLLRAAGDVECVFDIDDFIYEFTSNVEYQSYANGIESAILMLTLLCNSNGESYYDLIPKRFNNSESNSSIDKYGFDNTYKDLFESLQSVITSTPKYRNYDLTLFSYDWRMSCADSATQLNNYITQMGYDSVVLVCHSMGGLVGSGYMAQGTEQRNTVEQYISFGTPHWGAVLAPTICMTGEIEIFFNELQAGQANILENAFHTLCTEVIIQYVVSNIPSVYELFPTDRYVNATGGYLSYNEGKLCTTYSETKAVYAKHMKGYKSTLMTSAENFHNSLYLGNQHIVTYTNTTLVFSNGYKTVQWMTYDPELFGIYFLYEYSWNNYGDSIVPTISATMNFSSCVYQTSGSHMGMIGNNNLFTNNNIINIIN